METTTPPSVGSLFIESVRLASQILDAAESSGDAEYRAFCHRVALQIWGSAQKLYEALPESSALTPEVAELRVVFEQRLAAWSS